mmetsp:Transcript_65303/g.90867  ORF Transcript_65303/g.90867 Transcript_65303/m.90867 type:complete len:141 (-) Transcript_65303:120-542(-)
MLRATAAKMENKNDIFASLEASAKCENASPFSFTKTMTSVIQNDQKPLQKTSRIGVTEMLRSSCCQTPFIARSIEPAEAKTNERSEAAFSPRTQKMLPLHTKTTEKAVRKSRALLFLTSSSINVNMGVQEETMETKATPP